MFDPPNTQSAENPKRIGFGLATLARVVQNEPCAPPSRLEPEEFQTSWYIMYSCFVFFFLSHTTGL